MTTEHEPSIRACLAHRCPEHRAVPRLNESCIFDGGAECGACCYEKAQDEGERESAAIRLALAQAADWFAGRGIRDQYDAHQMLDLILPAVRGDAKETA